VRIGGMPASIEYKQDRGAPDSEVRVQAVFDDAARGRFGFDLNNTLSGPVPVRLPENLPELHRHG
jgi:hypothetical protein